MHTFIKHAHIWEGKKHPGRKKTPQCMCQSVCLLHAHIWTTTNQCVSQSVSLAYTPMHVSVSLSVSLAYTPMHVPVSQSVSLLAWRALSAWKGGRPRRSMARRQASDHMSEARVASAPSSTWCRGDCMIDMCVGALWGSRGEEGGVLVLGYLEGDGERGEGKEACALT